MNHSKGHIISYSDNYCPPLPATPPSIILKDQLSRPQNLQKEGLSRDHGKVKKEVRKHCSDWALTLHEAIWLFGLPSGSPVDISKTGNGGGKEQSLAKRERICVPLKGFEQWSMGRESGKMRIEVDDDIRVGIWTILSLSIRFRTQFNSYFFKVLQEHWGRSFPEKWMKYNTWSCPFFPEWKTHLAWQETGANC